VSARIEIGGLRCLRCGRLDDKARWRGCEACAAEGVRVNLSVAYDLAPLAGTLGRESLAAAAPGVWRFASLLPDVATRISLGEGGSPLIPLERLGRRLGLSRLYAKDESRNPTWSFKDRLNAVAVSHGVHSGASVFTVSSTGNHGASTAAYAARAGRPCVVFTTADVPDTMKRLMQAYGAAVVACPDLRTRWSLMGQCVDRFGWYPTSGFVHPPIGSNPYGIEGYKTIAYEIVEAFGWEAPDAVIVPADYSDGLHGVWKGMRDLLALKVIAATPRMFAAEPHGPLADAMERGLAVPEPVDAGESIAFSVAGTIGTYQGLIALRESGGAGSRITDEALLESQRWLAQDEGLFVEPSSATAVAAALQLRQQGKLAPDDRVVLVLTSGGLKDPDPLRAAPALPLVTDDLGALTATLKQVYDLAVE
jgi:threonine synthase